MFEPADGWSRKNLIADAGSGSGSRIFITLILCSKARFTTKRRSIPLLIWTARMLCWFTNGIRTTSCVAIGEHHAEHPEYTLFFHDTHHRAATDPDAMAAYDLRHYNGVLAYGEVIRDIYKRNGWAREAWTWHEAADATVFRPRDEGPKQGDLVWIGNWGDGERGEELRRVSD